MGQIVIEGGAVVTLDEQRTIHDPGWILIDDDRITAVGAGDPPPAARAERVDARGTAVMPGMVNAHTHLFQSLLRGLADDKPLLDWLHDCIWPGAVHLNAEMAYLAALAGLMENIRGGATAVIDHQYVHVDEAIDDAVCRAADEVGVRFTLARGWADRNYEQGLMEPADVVVRRTRAVRDAWHGHDGGRIRVGVAPLIPWGCSDDGMRETLEWARSWGGSVHVHCAETAGEVELSIDERGMRHVAWLDELGALGPDTQLAHSVWVDEAELDRIAASGTVVVHCPVSNMYLASGVAPVTGMRRRGIQVALATDGPGSNNRQDMFEVLKTTVLLQKLNRLDAMAMQPEDALEMACRGGAAALGMADELGLLEPGRKADVIVVDLTSPFVAPVHRVSSALVFCATPRDVVHTIVDGRFVLRERRIVAVEEAAVMEAATAAAGRLLASAGLPTRLSNS